MGRNRATVGTDSYKQHGALTHDAKKNKTTTEQQQTTQNDAGVGGGGGGGNKSVAST